ncbi:MAG: hypothetical protein ACI9OE_000730, partial [Mariniflexile sp.]
LNNFKKHSTVIYRRIFIKSPLKELINSLVKV